MRSSKDKVSVDINADKGNADNNIINADKGTGKGRLYAVRAAKALAFLAVCVVVNVLITLALEPYGNIAEVTWDEYRSKADEKIDTIIVGTSLGRKNIDPYILDDLIGCSSFSLATPSQSLPNMLASLTTAYEDHGVKRAVIVFGPESLQEEPWYYPQVTFMQSKSLGDSLPKILENVGRIAFYDFNFPKAQSLTWAIPWFYSSVDLRPGPIMKNIRNRLTISDSLEAYKLTDPSAYYAGKGHGGYDFSCNFTTTRVSGFSFSTDDPPLDRNVQDLRALLQYCADHDIETYVTISPRPNYANLNHQDDGYPALMSGLQQLVEEYGATYYDLSCTKPDFYRPIDSDFNDGQHLNIDGATRLTTALGTLIRDQEAGNDVSGRFFAYEDWDEQLATYDQMELCYYEYEVTTSAIELSAHAIAQPDVTVEYQYSVKNPATKKYEVVRSYSTDPDFTYALPNDGDPTVHGKVRMRVLARVVGTKKAQKHYQLTISY